MAVRLLLLSSCSWQICVAQECLTLYVSSSLVGTHYYTSQRACIEVLLTQAHDSSDRTAYPRGSRCHISHYIKPCKSSLCMELLWLLVRSSWSQRQKSSPKCECEHALSMKYLTTNCFIRILRRILINFQLERRVLAALCTSMACSFGKCVFGAYLKESVALNHGFKMPVLLIFDLFQINL